eukprot:gene28708-14443_t
MSGAVARQRAHALTEFNHLHSFKDLTRPLAANRASSFVNDACVRHSLCSRSKSFITARDGSPTVRQLSPQVPEVGEDAAGLADMRARLGISDAEGGEMA